MKKIIESDWLKAMQLLVNKAAKTREQCKKREFKANTLQNGANTIEELKKLLKTKTLSRGPHLS